MQQKILKGDKPYTVRPGALLPPADFEAEKQAAEKTAARAVTETEFASYLMYPKVFADFMQAQALYGSVSVLPTSVYFYGLELEKETVVDIESGKSLVVRNLALGEGDEQGMVTVFFELNGQARHVTVPDRAQGASANARSKAESGNANHIGAPMSGVVSAVSVKVGDTVKAGDAVVFIEAMKMETALHAEKDAVIRQVLVKQGDQVHAKDLLVRME